MNHKLTEQQLIDIKEAAGKLLLAGYFHSAYRLDEIVKQFEVKSK